MSRGLGLDWLADVQSAVAAARDAASQRLAAAAALADAAVFNSVDAPPACRVPADAAAALVRSGCCVLVQSVSSLTRQVDELRCRLSGLAPSVCVDGLAPFSSGTARKRLVTPLAAGPGMVATARGAADTATGSRAGTVTLLLLRIVALRRAAMCPFRAIA